MRVLMCLIALPALSASADVITLNPIADAFVASSAPTSNFGGAGAVAVAAAGLPQGEFQSVLRFNTSSAVTAFNSTFGTGQWTIQSITLQLSCAAPNHPIFNEQAAGQFAAGWMQNDSWTEGSGTPAAPGGSGITFATLPSFLSGADEGLGTYPFDGSVSGNFIYSLALAPGFSADIAAGGQVSLRLSPLGSTIAYLSNSRSFPFTTNRPVLSITAVPSPSAAILLGLLAIPRRSRRCV